MTTRIDQRALRRQIFFWLLALGLFIAFLMVFRSILLPFIAGMALAYFSTRWRTGSNGAACRG
jgi:predicted PurR-regulated permease PerM